MIHLLDESIEAFLRQAVPLSEREVDVAFEAPDNDWGARITRPTVNLFLWDVRRNANEAQIGLETHQDAEGRTLRRKPLPRVDCRYLVTAWTSDIRDEHSLLGAVLGTLLGAQEIPAEQLAAGYETVRPLPALRLPAQPAEGTPDVWSALGGKLKPGLDLVVTATVDAGLPWRAAPRPRRVEVTLDSVGGPGTGGRDLVAWEPDENGTLVPAPPSGTSAG